MFITYPQFEEFREIVGFTTTRQGGVSRDERFSSFNVGVYTNDDVENINANRAMLCRDLGVEASRLFNAHQTHGDRIVCVDEAVTKMSVAGVKDLLEGCDGLITAEKGVCVAVTTADCVPVLLYDRKRGVAAAVHSGWRGTLLNISAKAVAIMKERYGSEVCDVVSVVGPCISQPNYQVGKDMKDRFVEKDSSFAHFFADDASDSEKCFMDIRGIVKKELEDAGLRDVCVSGHCTFRDADLFFSARRQGIDSGRMLSGLVIK
ncbi:MAG: peptidoglycan editing factor PgeF [Paludibacteraceae bacterium]|nr:peptidoglycan editing factor PgeF [Paludibacteraceae bacterium]